MILAALSSIVMLQAAAAPAAPDAALERLRQRVGTCIQANAAVVERNDPNLADAATFLVEYVCANEVQVFERYRTNVGLLAGMRNMQQFAGGDEDESTSPPMKALLAKQATMYQSAHVDPDSGQIVYPPGSTGPFNAGIDLLPDSVPAAPEFRVLAARTVLQARQSRLGQ